MTTFGTASASGKLLHVGADAAESAVADGSRARPYRSLRAVEQASAPGDTIVVLAAPLARAPLDGGIALKPGQVLLGEAAGADRAARITNTGSGLDGDAVVLAPGAEVAGLLIENPRRGGIYGRNAPGVRVHDNEIVGHNRGCALGLIIPPISIPSSIPGIVIPQPLPLPNGWAAIMIDADHGDGHVAVHDNIVRHSECGDGIDLRLSGDADYTARIDGNTVYGIKQGPLLRGILSVLAIGMQTLDRARLDAALDRNTQYDIGDAGSPSSDSEGVFATLAGDSQLIADINRNTFYRSLGGWSANGLEIVINSGAARAAVQVRNSSFVDVPGDVIEGLNLGIGSYLELKLDNVIAKDSTGAPFQNLARPFTYAGNLGDCLVMTSAGAGNTLWLEVRNSRLENCVNNGVTISSNAMTSLSGAGAVERIHFDIDNSRIVGHRFHNLKLAILAPVSRLSGRIQNSDLGAGRGDNLNLERSLLTAAPTQATLDFGGGALGSVGNNCFDGGGKHDLQIKGLHAALERNWWGQANAPPWWRAPIVMGDARFTPVATAAPAHCRR
ncbi:DUF1565 domain-containing protein [Lysobacter sp. CA199]|uniref:DUF1565 domain-containing protein n=1 Tax=Lysobacter sp. CA199 TaxID=3455608 RepID=UPI003F8D425E